MQRDINSTLKSDIVMYPLFLCACSASLKLVFIQSRSCIEYLAEHAHKKVGTAIRRSVCSSYSVSETDVQLCIRHHTPSHRVITHRGLTVVPTKKWVHENVTF